MQFVAHARTRAASTLMSMLVGRSTGVEMSLDAARMSACATVTIWLRSCTSHFESVFSRLSAP
jgi:hypothetical protein